jgi:hypothetical protein
MPRRITPISTRAIGVLLGLAALGWMIAPAPARADTVTDWNGYASTAIVATATQPPPVAVLSFAMVQGAVYDAVNAIDRGHRAYLPQPPARASDSKDAAAATAAYRVLIALFPLQQPALQPLYDASLAGVADTPAGAKPGGIADGEAAAAAMLAARANDGRFPGSPFTPVYGTTPGVYRPTTPGALDPGPWVGNVRPFVVPNVDMLRTQPPNALRSRAYARDLNEIKEVGSLHSTTRTADETSAAIFWQDHAFALWNRAFRTLAASRHLDIAQNARLFASENLAAADAAIGCWNNKYHWNTWRPITAIREAAADGNPATEADPSWTPLFDPSTPVAAPPALVTPPFPEHPSGHNCAAGAILRTLRYFFHTDEVPFSASSNKTATTRTYQRVSDALRENINARVWAGIHFRTADIAGAARGKKVARYLHKHYLQPVD